MVPLYEGEQLETRKYFMLKREFCLLSKEDKIRQIEPLPKDFHKKCLLLRNQSEDEIVEESKKKKARTATATATTSVSIRTQTQPESQAQAQARRARIIPSQNAGTTSAASTLRSTMNSAAASLRSTPTTQSRQTGRTREFSSALNDYRRNSKQLRIN